MSILEIRGRADGSGKREVPSSRRLPAPAMFVLRRVLSTIGLLIGVTLTVFLVSHTIPTDPVKANLGDVAASDPVIVDAYRAKFGLDDPLPVQYFEYVKRLVHGDLGTSIQSGSSVSSELAARVPATVELALAAIVVALLVSIPLGTTAALRKNRSEDTAIQGVTLLGMSAPAFWVGLVALQVFFLKLGWFPGGERLPIAVSEPPKVNGLFTVDSILSGQWATLGNALHHLILPAVVLALPIIALVTRFVRGAVIEVLNEDYVLNAKAKGLPPAVIIRSYVLRGAMPQILTVIGLALANAFVGTVLVEQVFTWPGMGTYAYQSAVRLDFPAVMGVCLVITVVYVLVNLVVDLMYGVVDPRIRVAS